MAETYSHTFEFDVAGIEMEGEIDWNGGKRVNIKTDVGLEAELKELQKMYRLIAYIAEICADCGEIIKINIEKKV
jgi:hypothetical protein